MDLFKTENKIWTDNDFSKALSHFRLQGKPVIVYSRLLRFGRIIGRETVNRIINILQEQITNQGTLCFPCYTFSAYHQEPFDTNSSKCAVGVLGEQARQIPGFVRTMHPVYSTTCWGKEVSYLLKQNQHTCFGPGSFFDLFSQLENAYVLMLGTNLSASTLSHFYDQRYQVPGRFIKKFKAQIIIEKKTKEIEFDAYVKNYDFYGDRMNALCRFDALATELNLITRCPFSIDWIQGIREIDYHRLYKDCSTIDPEYFLISSQEEFKNYYEKNDFKMLHGKLDPNKTNQIKIKYDRYC